MGFENHYSVQLDEKNRMRIPAKYREELGEKFSIFPLPDNSIKVLSFREACLLKESLSTGDHLDHKKSKLNSLVSGFMVTPEPDDQGRFVLPPEYRKFAKIQKNIVVVGAVDCLLIWSEEEYNKEYDMQTIDFEEIFRRAREPAGEKTESAS